MSDGGGGGKGSGSNDGYGGWASPGEYTPPQASGFVDPQSSGSNLQDLVSDTGAGSFGDFGTVDTAGGYSGAGTDGGMPGSDFGGGGYSGGGDGGDLPSNATLTAGDSTGTSFDTGGMPYDTALRSAANVAGPAGSSGAPDVAALNDAFGNEPGGTSPDGGDAVSGSGPSAAGVAPYSVGGATSTDLSAQKRDKTGKGDDSWLSSLGIKNPLGTAVAAGALGYNMLKGQTQPAPVRDLNQLAQDLRASTSGITPEGRAIATTGASNLNTRAGELDPMSQELQNRGAGLTKYVGTGTLPPEMQTQVDQATKDAKTARLSFYASRGMPTDPTMNTALRSDLEGIDRQAVIMASTMASDLAKTGTGIVDTGLKGNQLAGSYQKSAGDIGTSMVNSGIQASVLQSQAYNQLAQIDQAQADRTQKAIAAMAASLSGGPQITNLRLT